MGSQGAMFSTITGGKTWIDRTRPCGSPCIRPQDLLRVQFTDFRNGWIAGERGAFLHTNDAGFTWKDVDLDTQQSFYGMAFPTTSDGWLVGTEGNILKITRTP